MCKLRREEGHQQIFEDHQRLKDKQRMSSPQRRLKRSHHRDRRNPEENDVKEGKGEVFHTKRMADRVKRRPGKVFLRDNSTLHRKYISEKQNFRDYLFYHTLPWCLGLP